MIGIIGKKIGMTQLFSDEGNLVPVTIIEVEPNVVVGKRLKERDGYNAVIIGAGNEMKEKHTTKAYRGTFTDGLKPRKILKEFRIEDVDSYESGSKVDVTLFNDVKYVDVIGYSIGRGFAGVIKRHGFSGGPAGHGSKFHRQNGSTGQCAYPSRGFKNVKRAGRMGNERTTIQSLQVIKIDGEKNYIAVKGNIPGKNKTTVILKKAVKK